MNERSWHAHHADQEAHCGERLGVKQSLIMGISKCKYICTHIFFFFKKKIHCRYKNAFLPGTSTVCLSLSTPKLHFERPDTCFSCLLLSLALAPNNRFQREGVPFKSSEVDDIMSTVFKGDIYVVSAYAPRGKRDAGNIVSFMAEERMADSEGEIYAVYCIRDTR